MNDCLDSTTSLPDSIEHSLRQDQHLKDINESDNPTKATSLRMWNLDGLEDSGRNERADTNSIAHQRSNPHAHKKRNHYHDGSTIPKAITSTTLQIN